MAALDCDVLTMGESMWLLVGTPGVGLSRVRNLVADIAGAESNVAIGLSRLGFRTGYVSRVGDDPAGAALLATLRSENVDVSAVAVDPDRPTGLLLRDSDPFRAITVQYARAGSAASALSPDDLPTLTGVRVVHVTGITAMLSPSSLAAVEALFDRARAAGATVSFDPNIRLRLGRAERWRRVVGPLLARADVVFAGADELSLLTGDDDPLTTARRLLTGTAHTVVIKQCDKSLTALTEESDAEPVRQRPLARHVVDAVGAGDAVATGYLAGWLRGAPPADALLAGAVCAALVVGAVTDTEGLPFDAELGAATTALAPTGPGIDAPDAAVMTGGDVVR